MCERIKKANAALDKYRQKATSVHQVADMVRKDVEKLEEQLLIASIVYMVASELAVDDYENHHLQQDKVRLAQKQERETALTRPAANGSKGLHFFR